MDIFRSESEAAGTKYVSVGDVEVIADNVRDVVYVTIDNGGVERGTFKFSKEQFAQFIAECQWVIGNG